MDSLSDENLQGRSIEDRKGPPLTLREQSVAQEAYFEDEIDLVELWRILLRQWRVICTTAVISVLGALAYVFLTPSVYHAQAVVVQPGRDLVADWQIIGISKPSSTDFFSRYVHNLKSSNYRQQFVNDHPQLSVIAQYFADKTQKFQRDNMPKVSEGKKDNAGFVEVTIQGPDSKVAADWVNGFLLWIDRKTVDEFCDGFEAEITSKQKALQRQLATNLDFAVLRRQDQITQLNDQIAIAQALKIFDRQFAGNSTIASQSVGVTLNAVQEPLYMRGVKELTEQKEALARRENDEPFIGGFRDKQESLAVLDATLKQVQEARADAHAARLDQLAVEDKNPVKPKRMLVLVISVVLGVVVGILVAFVVNFAQQQKKKLIGGS